MHVALYATLVAMFPVIVLGIVVLLLQVELPLGVLPRDTLVNTSDAHETSRAAAAVRCVPPVVFRLVFRTLFLASMLFFAEMLIGAGLAFFANIAGALGLCATTYWLPYLLYFLLGETLHQMRPTAFDQAGRLRLQLEPWQMKEKWDLECSRKKAAARRQAEAEAKAEAAAERQAERERSHKKSLYRKDRKGLSRKKRASKERAGSPPNGERSVGGRAGAAEMV